VKISRSSIQGFQDQVYEDSDLFFKATRQVTLNILCLNSLPQNPEDDC
jgi:hypothetical protein